LETFSGSRRTKRDPKKIKQSESHLHSKVGLPIGNDAEFFVNGGGYKDEATIDYNCPPNDQPNLWCQWIPSEDGSAIEWDGGEKFYDYIDWIEYIITHFLTPWGITANGSVEWQGEDSGDFGKINIKNSLVSVVRGPKTFN
jgi:hypothetical protein